MAGSQMWEYLEVPPLQVQELRAPDVMPSEDVLILTETEVLQPGSHLLCPPEVNRGSQAAVRLSVPAAPLLLELGHQAEFPAAAALGEVRQHVLFITGLRGLAQPRRVRQLQELSVHLGKSSPEPLLLRGVQLLLPQVGEEIHAGD